MSLTTEVGAKTVHNFGQEKTTDGMTMIAEKVLLMSVLENIQLLLCAKNSLAFFDTKTTFNMVLVLSRSFKSYVRKCVVVIYRCSTTYHFVILRNFLLACKIRSSIQLIFMSLTCNVLL